MAEAKPKAELDQEWGELVEEHRLAMPGVQVLFAFLLILPFQNRFERLTENQEYAQAQRNIRAIADKVGVKVVGTQSGGPA